MASRGESGGSFVEFVCEAIPGAHLTDRARKVMALTQRQAEKQIARLVEPEHVLLALAEEGAGLAAHALLNLGADFDRLQKAFSEVVPAAEGNPPQKVGWSPRTQLLIAAAEKEAKQLRHNSIGAEHLLLAIAACKDEPVLGILAKCGIEPQAIRKEVYSLLGQDT